MLRKTASGLIALLLVLRLGTGAAAATATGAIRIALQGEGGELTLYHAGAWTEDGYLLEPGYGGGLIKQEDIMSPALAQWLSEKTGIRGEPRLLDADGAAVFSNLAPGLYLVTQTQTQKDGAWIDPILISLPYEDQWDLKIVPNKRWPEPENPSTGQEAGPLLAGAGMALSGLGLLACCLKKTPRGVPGKRRPAK